MVRIKHPLSYKTHILESRSNSTDTAVSQWNASEQVQAVFISELEGRFVGSQRISLKRSKRNTVK